MRRVEVRGEVVLLPVLEVAPFHFSRLELPQIGGSREHPAEWDDFFRRCMADAGFSGVEPIKSGSSFVVARSLIGNALLEQLVREAVSESLEETMKLSGGLALFGDGEALLVPSCCADLSNLKSWDELVSQRRPLGTIWVGHPELAFALDGHRVTLTEQWEYPPPPADLVEVSLSFEQLVAAVQRARTEVELFRAELLPIVTHVLGSAARAAAVTDALVDSP